jgi:hypothetical protein
MPSSSINNYLIDKKRKKMVGMGTMKKMPMGTTPATRMKISLPGE